MLSLKGKQHIQYGIVKRVVEIKPIKGFRRFLVFFNNNSKITIFQCKKSKKFFADKQKRREYEFGDYSIGVYNQEAENGAGHSFSEGNLANIHSNKENIRDKLSTILSNRAGKLLLRLFLYDFRIGLNAGEPLLNRTTGMLVILEWKKTMNNVKMHTLHL